MLLYIYTIIYYMLDLGKINCDIFVDLSKLFDTIDHTILMQKFKYYAVNGI